MDGSSAPHSETPSRCSVTLEFDVVPASKSVLTRELSGDDRDPEKCASDDYHDEQSQSPVTWDGDDDPENPQNWSTPYKWLQTVMVAVMTINVTFASSAPTTATMQIAQHFHVSSEVATLTTALFLLGYVFGPPVWGPGSEIYGRLPMFWICMTAYTLLHLGQALAPNIQTLLITRFFSGFFAVAPLTNSGGLIADIWAADGRGPATTLFASCVFIGPVAGPIVGGYMIENHLSWRWIFWVMMIFAGVCTAVSLTFLPETFAPVILHKKAKRLRKANPNKAATIYSALERQDWSFMGVLNRSLFRPFYMLANEPILLLVTIYTSLVYGVLYGLFEALPVIFIGKHHFTISQSGLIFIGIGIGVIISAIINIRTASHYPALIKKWKGFPPPEERLYAAMIGAPLLVVASFWLGWTGNYPSVPWYVPALSTIVMGTGIITIFVAFLSYLIDTYLMYSASAFAANTVVRSAIAAAFPLFTVQMFHKLGVNWAATLLGLLALVLAPMPFLFFKYGARVREKSPFAPAIDLRIAKEIEAEARAGQDSA